jgi:Baseplate J-like protein
MAQASPPPSIVCPRPVLRAGAQGIARVAVDDARARLMVTFLRPLRLPAEAFLLDPRSYSLTGGQRRFPRVLRVEPVSAASPPDPDGRQALLTLDQLGDFSVYTLTVSGPEIDPFFESRPLRFRLACGDPFDCRSPAAEAVPPAELPVAIDYLAKDYSSFRQALIDFIPTRLPAWTERSEADLGMTLLELLAATADTLSYVQDRVANEAFLGSATQRRSVAGHLALVGYQMDEGASARTWLQFQVNEVHTLGPGGFQVSNAPTSDAEPVIVFETLAGATLDPRHNEMRLFTWGHENCCLPREATSAVLAGRFDALKAGDYLLFEDDRGHRDVVRLVDDAEIVAAGAIVSALSGSPPLTSPPLLTSPLLASRPLTSSLLASPPLAEASLTLVRWSEATPLHHEYCLGLAETSPPAPRTRVRGNLVVTTHGETVRETLQPPATGATAGLSGRRQRLWLGSAPLAHLDAQTRDLVAPPTGASSAPATGFTTRPVRSTSTLRVEVDGEIWHQQPSLLGGRPDDHVFRVEIDDQGAATLVFGDDVFGQRLPDGAIVTATYRVGGGTAGNVGANTLTRPLPLDAPRPWLVSVTNPLAAIGGRDAESRDHARRVGPATFQAPLVAVTADDYQARAQAFTNGPGRKPIQRATATFRWTGSWLTVRLAVDPRGGETLTPALSKVLRDHLDTSRLTGYDLAVVGAVYVSVDLAIEFCVARGGRASDIQQALQQTLSNGDLPGGRKGFFHPDNFSFGDHLYVSRIFAAVMAVVGVESAQITRLARLHAAEPERDTVTNLRQGLLAIGPGEIVRLDNDRNFPERGTLTIRPRAEA